MFSLDSIAVPKIKQNIFPKFQLEHYFSATPSNVCPIFFRIIVLAAPNVLQMFL